MLINKKLKDFHISINGLYYHYNPNIYHQEWLKEFDYIISELNSNIIAKNPLIVDSRYINIIIKNYEQYKNKNLI